MTTAAYEWHIEKLGSVYTPVAGSPLYISAWPFFLTFPRIFSSLLYITSPLHIFSSPLRSREGSHWAAMSQDYLGHTGYREMGHRGRICTGVGGTWTCLHRVGGRKASPRRDVVFVLEKGWKGGGYRSRPAATPAAYASYGRNATIVAEPRASVET